MMRFRNGRMGKQQVGRPAGAARSRLLLAAAVAAALLPATAVAQDSTQGSGAGSPGVTFFTGPNFTGTSKTLTLAPDQPYAAIPFVGDELNEKIASLRADPQVGVILFQRPYFASRDDACGPNLGTAEDPDAWWLGGLTADFAPPYATDQEYDAAELPDDDYSSVIAYRREFGPPPGFLLMERRSYYNRGCERSADQSYFNRAFIPVPNPPQREACTDLATVATAYGSGADAPRFTRVTDAVALVPEAYSRSYQGIDHRFILTLFDGPGCSGTSITLPSREHGKAASYRLSAYEFDRKVKSVMIRYQRGPLDAYMTEAAAPAEATLAPAPAPAPMAAPVAPAVASPPAAPAPQAAPQPAPQVAPQVATPPAASGGLQPAPPSAPPQSQQQVLQPIPVPVAPAPAPAPSRPTGPQEETFRFPVHQVYRLNFCLAEGQGCGEPAANAWCKDRGFARASRWTQEENIGALYPTVFIGNGSICDKFLCDGFEEISCTQ